MKIISLKTDSSGLGRIELSDGSLFSFKSCYLPSEVANKHINHEPADGCEISAFEEEAFRFASACLRAEKTALRLIARAEQNKNGIRRKLDKRGHSSSCVSAVIEHLSELSLLDDNRFARLWLESRLRLPRSPRRLLIALHSRGIDRDDADAAIKSVLDEETEFSLLLRFVKKYSGKKAAKNEDTSNNRSLKFLLKNEGFSYSVIEKFFLEK